MANRRCYWTKYKKYQLVTIDGTDYVAPIDMTAQWNYNPVNLEEQLLCDVVNLGKELTEHPEHHDKVIRFVDKYGLLGLYPELADQDFDFTETLVVRRNIFLPQGVILKREFHNYFFPEIPDFQKPINSYLETLEERCANIFKEDQIYAEPLSWIEKYVKYLYSFMDRDDGLQLAEFNSSRLFQYIDIENYTPILILEHTSLKSVIDYAFSEAICSIRNPLRYCKHCNNIFYAKDIRSEFCSARCRNQYNVYKSRAKH